MESEKDVSGEPFADEIVRLNVGGTFFMTRKALLLQSPFFEGMFRFQDKERSADGSFFVDRNPKVFEVILELFRTGVLFWHDEIQLRAILIEADYYLISDKVVTFESDVFVMVPRFRSDTRCVPFETVFVSWIFVDCFFQVVFV